MVHERLRRYLKENGIKAKFIADKVGKSEPWMSSILNGRTNLKADELGQISAVLGVSPSIFFDEKIHESGISRATNEQAATSA